ncbi:hypothetical protein VB636_00960, partial [Paracoccus sp. APAP_BH8]
RRGLEAHAIGRSRGGLTTQPHAAADAFGRPIRVTITPGHWADSPQAKGLICGLTGIGHVIADIGCDTDALCRFIAEEMRATAQIKPNHSRTNASDASPLEARRSSDPSKPSQTAHAPWPGSIK